MRPVPLVLAAAVSSLCLFRAAPASSYPAAQGDVPPPAGLKQAFRNDFEIYVDVDPSMKVIYYVPKSGYVAVDGAMNLNPVPRLSVTYRTPMAGFFSGHTLTYVGGSLSTLGAMSTLSRLEDAARAIGYEIAPAPVDTVKTYFMVRSRALVQDEDGMFRVDVQCQEKTRNIDGKPVPFVSCATKSNPQEAYDLDTELMYKFFAPPYRGSTVNGRIPFQGILIPGWDAVIEDKLAIGEGWDNFITAEVEWGIRGGRRTHKAVLTINWQSLFEQTSSFVAAHVGGCIDVEVQDFFQRIAVCEGSAEKCGVSVQWFDIDGKPTDTPSAEEGLVSAVKAMEKELRDELFVKIRPAESVLGRVRTDTSAFFTARVNHEKRIVTWNETRTVWYNPGTEPQPATTTLNIDCLKRNQAGLIRWNQDDPGCKELLHVSASE